MFAVLTLQWTKPAWWMGASPCYTHNLRKRRNILNISSTPPHNTLAWDYYCIVAVKLVPRLETVLTSVELFHFLLYLYHSKILVVTCGSLLGSTWDVLPKFAIHKFMNIIVTFITTRFYNRNGLRQLVGAVLQKNAVSPCKNPKINTQLTTNHHLQFWTAIYTGSVDTWEVIV